MGCRVACLKANLIGSSFDDFSSVSPYLWKDKGEKVKCHLSVYIYKYKCYSRDKKVTGVSAPETMKTVDTMARNNLS